MCHSVGAKEMCGLRAFTGGSARLGGSGREDGLLLGMREVKEVICGVMCWLALVPRYQTNKRKPYHGINFVVCHDGFTLYDLVSYNNKHNDSNGEQGRDGSNDNFSWNCGFEGETGDAGIKVAG